MKLQMMGRAALVASLCIALSHATHAQRQREYQTANMAASAAVASLSDYNNIDSNVETCNYASCGCDECCDECCDDSCCGGCGGGLMQGGLLNGGMLTRPGQLFFGAEYIYARASFSEALAYVTTDGNLGPINGGPQFVEFDFGYESSYRFYGGYRFCDCGGEITFNYGRYRSDAAFSVTDNGVTNDIRSPYEVDAPDNGILTGGARVNIDSYDIGFSKTIPLGSPLCGSCCCGDDCCGDSCCGGDDCCGDSCCGDACGCCWCPAWDITWSAGVRFAEVDWSRGTSAAANAAANRIDTANTQLDFDGVGARVGMLGRRYLGRNGLMSIYAKGDISLLVGDMNIRTLTIQDPDGTAPLTALSHRNSGRRVIPVTEIEMGGTVQISQNIQASTGYFISAWHDLGMRDEYEFENPGGAALFQLSHYDDANILGFDGFFARVEVGF